MAQKLAQIAVVSGEFVPQNLPDGQTFSGRDRVVMRQQICIKMLRIKLLSCCNFRLKRCLSNMAIGHWQRLIFGGKGCLMDISMGWGKKCSRSALKDYNWCKNGIWGERSSEEGSGLPNLFSRLQSWQYSSGEEPRGKVLFANWGSTLDWYAGPFRPTYDEILGPRSSMKRTILGWEETAADDSKSAQFSEYFGSG